MPTVQAVLGTLFSESSECPGTELDTGDPRIQNVLLFHRWPAVLQDGPSAQMHIGVWARTTLGFTEPGGEVTPPFLGALGTGWHSGKKGTV